MEASTSTAIIRSYFLQQAGLESGNVRIMLGIANLLAPEVLSENTDPG
jgi:hypothetical protein